MLLFAQIYFEEIRDMLVGNALFQRRQWNFPLCGLTPAWIMHELKVFHFKTLTIPWEL